MRKKALIATLVLTFMPSLGFATGCSGADHRMDSANQCGEGQSFDPATGGCIVTTTS